MSINLYWSTTYIDRGGLMNYEYVKMKVKSLINEKRFIHSKNVEVEAIKLAERFKLNIEKIRLAAIAHDIAKDFDDELLLKLAENYGIIVDDVQRRIPFLLHGPVGAFYCKHELMIDDQEIFNAIYYHTTGRPNMTLFEQVIFIADMVSIDRNYPGVDKIKELLIADFDIALVEAVNGTLKFVIDRNLLIHPLTIDFRNWLLTKGGE